jgi:sugar lactone lactonase YvrE
VNEVEVALHAKAIIGEAPTWSAEENALYWIDIKKPALHRYAPESGAMRTWGLTSDIGAFALCGDDGAVVALRKGLYRLSFKSGALDLLAPPPFDPELFRFNEGICDHTGRFWIGVMFDPVHQGRRAEHGSLHSFTLDGGLRRENDEAELHNGMAIDMRRNRFFLSHSQEGKIFVFDLDAASGRLLSRKEFAAVPTALGVPDGAALDEEGCYWCAIHGGGRIHRYGPDGSLDRAILLEVSQPTMCAFGGQDLETLYVTSASEGVPYEALAGSVLRLRPGVKGIQRHCQMVPRSK